jgi:hypothetical protein
MNFFVIALLIMCSLFDYWYQKIRLDILIILLIISLLFRIEICDTTKLIQELLFLTSSFSIPYIINHLFNKTLSFGKNKLLKCLSLGDKILFLFLILYSGIEKGLLIILFGLLTALLWVKVQGYYFKRDSYQGRAIPIYPFMAFSLIIIDIV